MALLRSMHCAQSGKYALFQNSKRHRVRVLKTPTAKSPWSTERKLFRIDNRRQIPPFSARCRRKTTGLHA